MTEQADVRVVAFYLPQFHPIPENDAWWGKGFTEWTNVTKAKPLFDGHYQPHLPADLGFYDLRVPEVRHAQAVLAKQYGVDAFCYHYYWFSGRRLLNRPLDDMLADATFNMPYCLCWANENWSRRWDGQAHELLMAQEHARGDEDRFIDDLMPHLRDPRYLRLNGAPLLIVYAPQQLPNPEASVQKWRSAAAKRGIERLHLCAALTHGNLAVQQWGFDSAVEFPPHNQMAPSVTGRVEFHKPHRGSLLPYAAFAKSFLSRTYADSRVHRTIVPTWDNTARTGERAVMLVNATPDNFEHWAARTLARTRESLAAGEQGLVFVNAWNEWAEGCHLEPDRAHGHAFLQALHRAIRGEQRFADFPEPAELPTDTNAERSLFRDLALVTRYHRLRAFVRLREWLKSYPLMRAGIVRTLKLLRLR
jgi:lipopolysaccharide biosynthesis protein